MIYRLPDPLPGADGVLSVTVGSTGESRARPIPLITSEIEMNLYPEGGLLVDGIFIVVYIHD